MSTISPAYRLRYASASEIVVPIVADGRLIGVFDIDSPVTGRFDAEDRAGLEAVVRVVLEAIGKNSPTRKFVLRLTNKPFDAVESRYIRLFPAHGLIAHHSRSSDHAKACSTCHGYDVPPSHILPFRFRRALRVCFKSVRRRFPPTISISPMRCSLRCTTRRVRVPVDRVAARLRQR